MALNLFIHMKQQIDSVVEKKSSWEEKVGEVEREGIGGEQTSGSE